MSSMLLISIYVLVKAKSKKMFLLSGVLFGITLYTYALSYIIIPIILLLLLGYMIYIKRIKISDIVVLFIPLIVLAIPLTLEILVNLGVINEIKTDYFSILKMWEFRSSEVNINNIPNNFINLIKAMFAFDINDYNAFPIFGTLYYISITFCIIGFIEKLKKVRENIKKREFTLDIIILINFIAVCICGLLVTPGINRINAIYISLIYYIAIGIIYISNNKKSIFITIISLYIVMFIIFLCYYFFIYGRENNNSSFNNDVVSIVEYIENNEKFDNKYINMRAHASQQYIYTLIGNKTSPKDFKATAIIDNVIYSYGRYRFYNIEINDNTVYVVETEDWLKDLLLKIGFTKEKWNDSIDIFYKK